MPRTARKTSSSGVYHVILRGVNKQQIFECSADYERFITTLRVQTQEENRCVVYAYCLMGNHVHLLLQEKNETLGETMKRIASSYVYYYNHKYDRVGHLFQERFKSQPVENREYFLTLLRYIHQNPLKPHLVENLIDYPWCSWKEYVEQVKDICSVQPVLKRISLPNLSDLIYEILDEDKEKDILDIDVKPEKVYTSDNDVWSYFEGICGAHNLSEFQALPRPMQKHYLYMAHEQGIGPRTLSRLTGISYSVVRRATSAENERKQNPYMASEPNPVDEEYYAYCDEGYFMQYPEY